MPGAKEKIHRHTLKYQMQNKHIEHFEDLMFTHGHLGLQMIEKISTKHVHSEKIDGCPAIIFGKNFVATKSIFNKKPIYFESVSAIENHGFPPDLEKKLILAFLHLTPIAMSGLSFQCDLLFIDGDIDIDGCCQPNIVKYEIPYEERHKKIGVAVHTIYDGPPQSLRLLSLMTTLLSSDDAFVYNCIIPKDKMEQAPKLEIPPLPKVSQEYFAHTKCMQLFKRFINALYREESYVDDFFITRTLFFANIDELYNKRIDSLKTSKGKSRLWDEKHEIMSFLFVEHREETGEILDFHSKLTSAKNEYLQYFNNITGLNNGRTLSEGIVIDCGGEALIKMIDRKKFSYLNFKKND